MPAAVTLGTSTTPAEEVVVVVDGVVIVVPSNVTLKVRQGSTAMPETSMFSKLNPFIGMLEPIERNDDKL